MDMTKEDYGDLKVNKIYLEVKTRTIQDFKIYKNSTQSKQLKKYKLQKHRTVYIWMTYNRHTNEIEIKGWNELSDFKHKFMDNGKYSSKGNKIRKIESLFQGRQKSIKLKNASKKKTKPIRWEEIQILCNCKKERQRQKEEKEKNMQMLTQSTNATFQQLQITSIIVSHIAPSFTNSGKF